MAENNLAINIVADSTKARIEFDALTAKARELRKELKGLHDEQVKTGSSPQTPQITATTRELENVEKQIKSTHTSTRGLTTANVAASISFKELARTAGEFGKAIGLPIEGLKILRIGVAALGAVEIVRAINATANAINDLVKASKQTGASTEAIQEFGRALEKSGGQAEDAQAVFAKARLTFDEFRKKALEAGETLGGPTVIKGGIKDEYSEITNLTNPLVTVLKGGQKQVVDFSNSLKLLQIDIRRFPGTEAGFVDYFTRVLRSILAFKNAGKIDQADILSMQYFGKSLRELGPDIQEFITNREALRQELIKTGQLATPADRQSAREYKAAITELSNAWSGLTKTLVTLTFVPIARFLDGLKWALEQIKALLDYVIPKLRELDDLTTRSMQWIRSQLGLSTRAAGAPGEASGAPSTRPGAPDAPSPMPAPARAPGAFSTTTTGGAGKAISVSGGEESDDEYYRRTGYHYGPRTGANAVPSGPAVGKPYGVPATSAEDLRKRPIDTSRAVGALQDAEYFARTGHHYNEGIWPEERALGARSLYPSQRGERTITQPGGYVPPERYAAPPGVYGQGAYVPGTAEPRGGMSVDSVTISSEHVNVEGAKTDTGASQAPDDISKAAQAIDEGATKTNNALSGVADALNTTASQVSAATQQILQDSAAAAAARDSGPPGLGSIDGQALGGLIRGPGSGTSDSILARLSNGEYVVNAASVRRLGTGFLNALNGFSLGGLVGTPSFRFAEGGLVGASGQPVNLHIGGGVFPTSATPAVAHALVIEAKRQQMSSAGVKPSWYGR